MENEIISILDETSKVINGIKEISPLIKKISEEIIKAYKNKKKVVLFGNGGSAADAQHIAAEFVGKFYKNREALPALAFHTNTSTVTATANDFGYDLIFERQVIAFVEEGDIVIGISTSGNSPNVLKGLAKAKEMVMLGNRLTSNEALRIGLVHKIVNFDKLRDDVRKFVEKTT